VGTLTLFFDDAAAEPDPLREGHKRLDKAIAKLEDRIEAFKQLAEQRKAEKQAYRKQLEAAVAKMTGWGPSWPGAPNAWDDFSICPDVNDDPGAAMAHLLSEISRTESFEAHEKEELSRLRKQMAKAGGAAADDGADGAEEPGGDDIVARVKPVKVTASARVTDDLAGNTATTVITFTFWNVGAKAAGYSGANGTVVTTFSRGGQETESCSGTFSGGPNGTLKMSCGGEPYTLVLTNGRTLALPDDDGELTVHNPDAFANWPRGL
jgi:hypothetical protein